MKTIRTSATVFTILLLTSCGSTPAKIDVKMQNSNATVEIAPIINTNTTNSTIASSNNNTNVQLTTQNTNTATPKIQTPQKENFVLTSKNEQITIQGNDVGGGSPMEGKKIYTGTYEIALKNSVLSIGGMTFSEGTAQDKKVDTIHLNNGTTIGAVYAYHSGNFSIATFFGNLPGSKEIHYVEMYIPGQANKNPNEYLAYQTLTSKPIETDGTHIITYSYDNSIGVWTKEYWDFDSEKMLATRVKIETRPYESKEQNFEGGKLLDEEAPTSTSAKVVFSFYKALRLLDTDEAVSYVISAKQGKTPYNATEMKDVYGRFATPIQLLSIKENSPTSVEVSYRYTKGSQRNVCEDKATVTLQKEYGEMKIAKILPKKGC